MRSILAVAVIAAFVAPEPVPGQQWSAEAQSVIQHVEACWQGDEDGGYEGWANACNPVDDFVFWTTTERTPTTNPRWWRGLEVDWHARYAYVAWDNRYLNVRIYGDVASVYYVHHRQVRVIADGSLVNHEEGILENYRRTSDGWEYLGGMGFVIEEIFSVSPTVPGAISLSTS